MKSLPFFGPLFILQSQRLRYLIKDMSLTKLVTYACKATLRFQMGLIWPL
jgi:hypothetical protein